LKKLACVLAAVKKHDKQQQDAVGLVYACATFGCDLSTFTTRQKPRLTLTEEQRALLSSSSLHRTTKAWLWEHQFYVGRVCRLSMTTNAMGKTRGKEHLDKKRVDHHSWRLGAKLADLVDVGAIDLASPFENWNDVVFPPNAHTLPL